MNEDTQQIIILEDHPIFREGLRSLLQGQDEWKVTGEADSIESAKILIHKMKPKIMLMDIFLGTEKSFHLMKHLKDQYPEIKIMVITMHSRADYIVRAFKAGATGYIFKESAPEQLLFGLKQVAENKFYIDSSIPRNVLFQIFDHDISKDSKDELGELTAREREIFTLLVEGLSIKEVAFDLKISVKTVDNHRSHIMHKLDLHSTMDLFKFAITIGFLDASDL